MQSSWRVVLDHASILLCKSSTEPSESRPRSLRLLQLLAPSAGEHSGDRELPSLFLARARAELSIALQVANASSIHKVMNDMGVELSLPRSRSAAAAAAAAVDADVVPRPRRRAAAASYAAAAVAIADARAAGADADAGAGVLDGFISSDDDDDDDDVSEQSVISGLGAEMLVDAGASESESESVSVGDVTMLE